ncbi:MAG: Hsp20/alpha crystallin family protein [Myxococcota bacterium]
MTPSADVIETTDALIVEMDLPGYELEDIDVQLEGERLMIRAERKLTPAPDRTYHQSERTHGVRSRTFLLPAIVDVDQTRATYRNGVLYLELPKRQEVKPRSIPINTGD